MVFNFIDDASGMVIADSLKSRAMGLGQARGCPLELPVKDFH